MKAEIKMKIPGPRSRALANKRIESVANGHGSVCGVYVDRAMGSNVIDVDGNVFIDFAGGIGTMNVGHSHPKILEAIERQISQFIHPCFTVAPYELYVKLAKKLSDLIPISDPCKAVFFNSGAEAVENAVKISKSYTYCPAAKPELVEAESSIFNAPPAAFVFVTVKVAEAELAVTEVRSCARPV